MPIGAVLIILVASGVILFFGVLLWVRDTGSVEIGAMTYAGDNWHLFGPLLIQRPVPPYRQRHGSSYLPLASRQRSHFCIIGCKTATLLPQRRALCS